jgi:hypothetical protein
MTRQEISQQQLSRIGAYYAAKQAAGGPINHRTHGLRYSKTN